MAEAKIVISASDQTKAAIESAKKNLAGLDQSASTLAGYFPAISAAISAAFSAQALKSVVDMLDRLDDLSEKSGISVESLSALRYAGEASGTSFEQLAAGLKKFSVNISEAAGGSKEQTELFTKLGVSVKDANGQVRDTDKILADVATKFESYADGANKSALAQKVFGKSGEDMIPLLNQGADGLERMAKEGKSLGAIFSGETAKQAAEFNDNLKKFGLLSEAVAANMTADLLPGLNKMAESFLEAKKTSGNFLSILHAIKEALLEIAGFDDAGKLQSQIASSVNGAKLIEHQLTLAEQQAASGIKGAAERAEILRSKFLDASAATDTLKKSLVDLQNKSKPTIGKSDGVKTNAPSIGSPAASDFSANFLNNLQTQYATLNGTISKTDEVKRQLAISSEKFTQSQKNEALSIAALIDQEKRRIAVEEVQKSQVKPFADKARDMQFEVSLIGKTAEETARLRFEYELTNRTKEAGIEVDKLVKKGVIQQSDATRALADIERFAAEARIEYARRAADEHDKQYNALRGLSEGMKDYWQSAERMGENTRNAVQNAFRGMEDAMVNFVKTGKLDFRSLADSVISDLIRIQIQQSITGPLARGMQAMLGGGNYSSTTDAGGYTSSAAEFANGGVMSGSGPLPMMAYSSGGIATSPQLALFGEGRMNEAYVPLPDGRSIPVTMSGGASNVVVNVHPTSGQTANVQSTQNGDGSTSVDIFMSQIQNSMADGVASGTGPLFHAMGSRFVQQGAV